MKRKKDFEKNIKICIKGQKELDLTLFDQIVYNELENCIARYESKYSDASETAKSENGAIREINIMAALKEDKNDFLIAMTLYRKFNRIAEKIECKIVVNDEVFADGIL